MATLLEEEVVAFGQEVTAGLEGRSNQDEDPSALKSLETVDQHRAVFSEDERSDLQGALESLAS